MGSGSGTGVEVSSRTSVAAGFGTRAASGCWVGAGDSCWGRSASDVLASDPGVGLPPSMLFLRVPLGWPEPLT